MVREERWGGADIDKDTDMVPGIFETRMWKRVPM
jgi:hypothetical protein